MAKEPLEKKEILLKYAKNDDFFAWWILANEIPFYIFDYDPRDELQVRKLASDFWKELENKWRNVCHINLYELIIDILTEKFWPEKYMELEEKNWFEYLSEHVIKPKIEGDTVTNKILELSKWHELIYLTHLWVAWPFLRAHSLLNNLAWVLPTHIVIVLFYPWSYDKKAGKMTLNLFDKFFDDHYYRAFPLCN